MCLPLAFELNLTDGVRLERRIFHSLFATKDKKEGECEFEKRFGAVP